MTKSFFIFGSRLTAFAILFLASGTAADWTSTYNQKFSQFTLAYLRAQGVGDAQW
jgi:hypothetical protein